MKIFSASQIRQWDAATIKEQRITSHELMERAAEACFQWITEYHINHDFLLICGTGNNGGDGLAIARMLTSAGKKTRVVIFDTGNEPTEDNLRNRRLLESSGLPPILIRSSAEMPVPEPSEIIIECLWGTGLNRPLQEEAAALAERINGFDNHIVAIDMPGGMLCDKSSAGLTVIHARETLSFCPKLSFLMAENATAFGKVISLDIGLSKKFESEQYSPFELPDIRYYASLIRPRPDFGHKGSFGSAALFAGSKGMMGAAILSARAYLQSGAGKLTCYVPACGYEIMQTAVPEAMCRVAGSEHLDATEITGAYDSIGCGPGLGTAPEISILLDLLLHQPGKLVIDADALNIIAANASLLRRMQEGKLLITPHPGEFDRLFGKSENDFERLATAINKAKEHQICIVLKGHHTAIISPGGKVKFNSSGNSGMAKPGSGDVLTGLLTGLLAQGYGIEEAACLGVHLHGLAGDLAADIHTRQAMTASNIIEELENSWRLLLNVSISSARGE
jgi:NAD(P)H-hydrate epimerase